MTRHEEDKQFLRAIIGVNVVALSLGILALLAYRFDMRPPELLAALISTTVVIGLIVCLGIHQDRCERRRQHEQKQQQHRARQESAPHTPSEFNDRLANYLHRPFDDVVEPAPRPLSKMPFWCRLEVLTRFGPKPTERIRQLLHRIRRAVHGRRNGHG